MAIIEHLEHPFGRGSLTANGIQWSAEKTTATDNYETVEEVTIKPPALGAVLEFEFGLTCAVKSGGAAESVLFKWQARNSGGSWVDLHTEATYAANASAYKEYTFSGRAPSQASLNGIPLDIRLQIKSGSPGGENATGKTKNSSYIRIVYAAS